jgi:hypothetical protein
MAPRRESRRDIDTYDTVDGVRSCAAASAVVALCLNESCLEILVDRARRRQGRRDASSS